MTVPNSTIRSPIDGTPVGAVPALSVADMQAKITQAADSQPAWAARSQAERGAILQAAATGLRAAAEELSDLLIREIGKTPSEARDEVVRSADLIDFVVAEAEKLSERTLRSEDFPGVSAGRVQRVRRLPLGVIAAIAPFNYPINLAVSKIAPALVLGNAVAFKPPTQGSVVGTRLAELCWTAGVPKEVLTLLTGSGSDTGKALAGSPAIAMVALTGSTNVGQQIARSVGMIPLMFELGGNDPAVVLRDADLDLAAEAIVGGAFKYAGQRCTAIKRVYVEEAVADALVAKLIGCRDTAYASAGDPREHPVGPVISDQQADYLQELLDDAVAQGGKVVAGGTRSGRYFEATIIDHLQHHHRLVTEEQFGPILPLVRVPDAAGAIGMANDSPYGLQACLFTSSSDGMRLAEQLEAGGVHLNDSDQRGPDNFLFIGHKQSGLMPQGVRFALEGMSKLQGIVTQV